MYVYIRIKTGRNHYWFRHRRLLQRYLRILKIIIGHNVSWNWHSINNLHWQKCRGKFAKEEHHILQESIVHPVTFSVPLIPELEWFVVMISPIKIVDVYLISTPKIRTAFGINKKSVIPHWLNKTITFILIKTVITDIQATYSLLLYFASLSSCNGTLISR